MLRYVLLTLHKHDFYVLLRFESVVFVLYMKNTNKLSALLYRVIWIRVFLLQKYHLTQKVHFQLKLSTIFKFQFYNTFDYRNYALAKSEYNSINKVANKLYISRIKAIKSVILNIYYKFVYSKRRSSGSLLLRMIFP